MMKHTVILAYLSVTLPLVFFANGCTNYVPTKLATTRIGDTLSLALSGPGAARWEPNKDSLVIECANCEPAREVEYFENSNVAAYEIPASEQLRLLLYTMGTVDTVNFAGAAPELTRTSKPKIVPRGYRAVTSPPSAKTQAETKAAEAKAAQAKAAEKVLSTTTLLKVTAPEGVAVYKDKTKREVLKILPQGSSIVLLAKEGDLYSVSIDGEEGFVDAEAVQIQK